MDYNVIRVYVVRVSQHILNTKINIITYTRCYAVKRTVKNYIMEVQKSDLEWLLNKTEKCSERYMEAEKFILELLEMRWYRRIFCFGKLLKFLKSRSKYNF